MIDNSIFKIYRFAKSLLLYQPPTQAAPFILEETAKEKPEPEKTPVSQQQEASHGELKDQYDEFSSLLRQAYRITHLMEKAKTALAKDMNEESRTGLQAELHRLDKQQEELTPILLSYDNLDNRESLGTAALRSSLEENLQVVNRLYELPANKDLVIREITLPLNAPVPAVLLFIDGMIDSKILNLSIMQPLLLMPPPQGIKNGAALINHLRKEILPANQVIAGKTFSDLQDGINSGDTVLLIDGVDEILIIGSKGWEHRSVGKPTTEQSIRGAQMAFSENLRINTALIRTMLRTSDLVTEMIKVGERSRVNCAVMYIKSITNSSLVAEVKRRIGSIRTDYIDDIGVLEQFIEDHPTLPFPQTISTERPDRVSVHLAEGRVAILLEGNPFVLVVPINMFSLLHSAEDFSLKVPAGSFMRLLRVTGTFISTMLPAFYIAISYFHQEALPTELVLAIVGSRQDVPFPAYFEVIVMEISFELIREASLRIPNILGSTIGIVGAIILGQAAVAANIVSPIMVVIIAITGLASFTIPEYRFAFAVRTVRFGLLFLAAVAGLVGLSSGILLLITTLAYMKSFGMPYLSPISPKSMGGLDVLIRGAVFRQESRPDALNTKDSTRQPHISRRWTMADANEGDDKP
ncbi:spore germination protein [Sporomusa sp.]|uniref:spore germination protein n=1 Tax=Sporomusa sp. TaxID=2078658 RepID=UPI002C0488D0|nr:spore germination protein [Sporomusa sp.]HWR08477.1 spore germination protein [Sporomusa sp.]